MKPNSNGSSCNCHVQPPTDQTNDWQEIPRKSATTVPSILLSVFIAFFPKCPFCWAVYMSMFGSLGIAKLPYLPWLLPVLLAFLLIHLFMQYKRIRQNGYLPFVCSLIGAVCLIGGRYIFPFEKWMLFTGMAFIIAGSLINALPIRKLFLPQRAT